MNNNFRPLTESEVKLKKHEVLNKLNKFLNKHKPNELKDILERKKQLREKAIKSFGDIQLKNLTYTRSSSKIVSDQSILLNEKQKDFLKENKSEILNLLEFIENVNGKNLSNKDIEKHMFDMTNVNTQVESMWYNTTKFIKKLTYPIALVSTIPGILVTYGLGSYFISSKENLIDLSVYLGMFGGFFIGGISAEYLHNTSKIAKRAEEIIGHNNIFVKAYIYHDKNCENTMENKI